MEELVYLKKNDAFTDSMVIAEGTENQHHTITRLLRKYRKDFEDLGNLEFMDFKSTNPKGGRPTKIYCLNEAQATLLITYLDNNEVVRNFKKNLVKQFYGMRLLLAEKQTAEWKEMRKAGMITRKAETDVIKELVELAKEQGSSHADMLYMTYTKLANKMAGINKREIATFTQLNNLGLFEQIILNIIRQGIAENKNYKQIYQDCKIRCETAKQIAFIG